MRYRVSLGILLLAGIGGCKEQPSGEPVRKAALSLPPLEKFEDTVRPAYTPAQQQMLTAFDASRLVVTGSIQSVDSTTRGADHARVYLVGVQVREVWKGPSDTAPMVYYLSGTGAFGTGSATQVFFLVPADHAFEGNARLQWKWLPAAPVVTEQEARPLLGGRAAKMTADTIREPGG